MLPIEAVAKITKGPMGQPRMKIGLTRNFLERFPGISRVTALEDFKITGLINDPVMHIDHLKGHPKMIRKNILPKGVCPYRNTACFFKGHG